MHFFVSVLTVVYLTEHLHYTEPIATIIYHFCNAMTFGSAAFSLLLAESYFGKFKMLVSASVLCIFGEILLTFGSVHSFDVSHKALSTIAIIFIAIGNGPIFSCISSYGVDQCRKGYAFTSFLTAYFITKQISVLCTEIVTPVLRKYPYSLSESNYILIFGMHQLTLIVALGKYVH